MKNTNTSKTISSAVAVIIFITILVVLIARFVGYCSIEQPSESYTGEQVKSILNSSSKIVVKKQLSLLTNKFVVYADEVPVATVEGKVLPLLGDTLCLVAPNGDILGQAKQEIFHLTAQASCSVGEESFSLKKSLIPFAGTKLANETDDSTFTWGILTKYVKEGGEKTFKTKKSFFADETIITRESDQSSYSPESVILVSCFDRITTNHSSSSSNSKNGGK